MSLWAGGFETFEYSRMKVPFPNIGEVIILVVFFKFCQFVSKTSSVFQLQKMIRCFLTFLTDIDLCHLRLGVFASWIIVKCTSHFSILGELSFYFSSFLRLILLLLILVKDFSYFSVAKSDFISSVWYWYVSLQVECFGTLRFSKMHIPFLSFWWYHLILNYFFHFLNFLTDFWYFENVRTILVIWYRCWCISLGVEGLNTFLECLTTYFHGLPHASPPMSQ